MHTSYSFSIEKAIIISEIEVTRYEGWCDRCDIKYK